MAEVLERLTALIILQREDKILLYKRINTWHEEGNYSLIGGNVDPGEVPLTAIIREVKEEVGVVLLESDVKLIDIVPNKPDDVVYKNHFYLATEWKGEVQNLEPDRCGELKWVSPDDLPTNTVGYVREAIEGYFNSD